jgi:hypothetical protein
VDALAALEDHGGIDNRDDKEALSGAVNISDSTPTPPPAADPGTLFVNSLQLPLPEVLVHTPPRSRRARREPDSVAPRRSDRLAAKSAFRDPIPEKQVKHASSTNGNADPKMHLSRLLTTGLQ